MTARQQEVPAIFGRRLIRERESRGWSLREAGVKVGVSAPTVMRAEVGQDCALSTALALAAAYGRTISDLLAEGPCDRCDGQPPAGFICGECGRGATESSSDEKGPRPWPYDGPEGRARLTGNLG